MDHKSLAISQYVRVNAPLRFNMKHDKKIELGLRRSNQHHLHHSSIQDEQDNRTGAFVLRLYYAVGHSLFHLQTQISHLRQFDSYIAGLSLFCSYPE